MPMERGAYEKKLVTRLMVMTGVICAVFALVTVGVLVSFLDSADLSATANESEGFFWVVIILFLSLTVILIMAGLIASFIVSHIQAPMEAVVRGIEKFDRGELTSFICLNRRDEWRIIENSLNAMASRTHENITRRQEMEEELRIARENLAAAEGVRNRLLADMSHEIRTPMNGIIGMTELLQTTRMAPLQGDYVEVISTSADALLTVLNDILDFSRFQEGNLALASVPFDLRTMVEQTGRLMTAQAREKGLEILVRYPQKAPHLVTGDPNRVRRIVMSLAGSAVKVTETGQLLMDVVAKEAGDQRCEFRIEVSDTGTAIHESHRKRISDSFSRGDEPADRRFKGSELGLAGCRRLAEMMGGTVYVDASRGKGSVFCFTLDLPLAAPAPFKVSEEVLPATIPAQTEDDREIAPDPAEPRGYSGARILLVEDNPMNQQVARGILGRFGCLVEVAENGKEALRSFGEKRYDLIFMDAHMPVMNGFDATRAIRERETGDFRIPIVALTALAMEGDRERCLSAGMDDHISKPVGSAAIKDVLDRFITPGQAPLTSPPTKEAKEALLLNPDVLMDITGSDPEIIDTLIGEFLNNAPEYLKALFEAIEQGDNELIFNASHRLKGMVASAGGEKARSHLDEIETKARNGMFIPDVMDLSPLTKELAQLKNALLTTDWNSLCGKNDPS